MKYKYLVEQIEKLSDKTKKDTTIEEEMIIKYYHDPVFLSQSINSELVELNETTRKISRDVSIIKWLLILAALIIIVNKALY